MSVLLFLAITFGAGTAGLLTRRRPSVSIPIGIAGLAGATVAGLLLNPGDRLQVGETALVVSEFQRLFVLFGSIAGLSVAIIALTGAWQRNLPSAMLLGLGALALGLGLADPVSGLAATAAAGLPGVLVAIMTPVDARGVRAAARELRAVAVTGALAVVAAALVSGPTGLASLSPTIVGLAYLAMAIAVAVRMGAIPFHTRVARVTGSAPGAALPLLLAWAPAGFAAAALVWIDRNISTTAIPLEPERLVIVGVGLLCVLLGILAATIQDDIEHVVGYSVIQDAGFVMLALAIFDIAAWEPARSWLLIYVATKSAFAGWALAMRDTFGTGRIAELSGWIRRAPVLALALAAIVVATVGIPGLLVFDVRSRIASLALGDPLAILAVAGGLGSLLYYGRLARVGIGPVAPLVAAYAGIRPRGIAAARAAAATAEGAPGATELPSGSGAPEPGPAAGSGRAGRVGRSTSGAKAALTLGLGTDATGIADGPVDGSVPTTAGADASRAAGEETDGIATSGAPLATAAEAEVEADAEAVAATSASEQDPTAGAADEATGAADEATGAADAATGAPPAGSRPRRSGAPELSALRRDPKEMTRVWAREALERAGLSPTAIDDAERARDGAASTASPRGAEADGDATLETPGAGSGADGRGRKGSGAMAGRAAVARALWAENRSLVAASLALLLAGLGLAAAAGGFGVAEAARAPAPLTGGSDGSFRGSLPGEQQSPGQPGSPDLSTRPSTGPDTGAPGSAASPGGNGPGESSAPVDPNGPGGGGTATPAGSGSAGGPAGSGQGSPTPAP